MEVCNSMAMYVKCIKGLKLRNMMKCQGEVNVCSHLYSRALYAMRCMKLY